MLTLYRTICIMNRKNKSNNERDSKSNSSFRTVRHIDANISNRLDSGTEKSDQHTKSVEFEHPVKDVEKLKYTGRRQYQLRQAQVDDGVEPGDRSQKDEHEVEKAFDLRVLDITNRVLGIPVVDATHGEFSISDDAVCTLVLYRVRKEPVEKFTSHLEAVPEVSKELGLDEKLDKQTISDWEAKLIPENKTAIDDCATRVLYTVYRSGQAFPQQVWNSTVASSETGLMTKKEYEDATDGKLSNDTTRDALKNWARAWLEACVSDEDLFGREKSQVKYPVTSIVGLFAHAAVESRTLTSASKTCKWVVDPELVPDRRTVMEPIKKMNVDEIAMLFDDLNGRFLEFANEYTILQGLKQLAFDPTDIRYFGEDKDDHWLKGNAQILKGKLDDAGTDADLKWEFGFAAMTEKDVQFALGMYPIHARSSDDEDRRESVCAADVISRLLRPTQAETPVEIDLVVMDRGVDGADVIRRCRDTLGDRWMSLWKRGGELKDLVEKTPQGKSRFYKLEERFADLTQKPNAIVVPAPYGETRSHWVFLTDLPKEKFLKKTEDGDEILDRRGIISVYQNRGRVETSIGQLKNDFEIPVRDNTSFQVTYFCLNIAMVFYNLHNLITHCLSPKNGFPLGKSRGASNGEVLCAIREAAFEMAAEQKSESTTPP